MQMLLVDTNAVVMHLINQVKRNSAEDLKYAYSKTYQEVSMRMSEGLSGYWTATITVDNEHEHEFPLGTIVLKKNGYPEIRGFFSRHCTPLLFEYAKDFCIRVNEKTDLSAIQALLKEALPNLKLP